MTYMVRNTYHNTWTRTQHSPDERVRIHREYYTGEIDARERRAAYRVWSKLCGNVGCRCSNNIWGERSENNWRYVDFD